MRKSLLSLPCLAIAAARAVIRRSSFVIPLLALAIIAPAESAEPFEIKDGDRVLFLGDTLLEREGTYGYLETRMAEQFPDRKFTVRNLAFSADTPLGWSRASFDPPAKGFERLKEQLALVKPTVVFLGYGMAASLQEMTDRSQDWTLNRDPARYGAEPMSAARFKKELAQCMDAIVESAKGSGISGQESGKDVPNGGQRASGRVGVPPAGSGVSPEPSNVEKTPQRDTPSGNARNSTPDGPRGTRGPAGGTPTLPEANPVRFVLLSPIRHEDLRATRPGLPDPTEHNKLLEQYSKAIEELAKERGACFVDLFSEPLLFNTNFSVSDAPNLTDNGIHLSALGYSLGFAPKIQSELRWYAFWPPHRADLQAALQTGLTDAAFAADRERGALEDQLRAAIIRKNALFFHRWRPANETYLFGFRKREQGQNAVEIPKFDPLIEAAEAEIERLKKSANAAAPVPNDERRASGRAGVPPAVPGILPGTTDVAGSTNPATPAANNPARASSADGRKTTSDAPGRIPGAAGNIPALPGSSATSSTSAATNNPANADTSRQTPAEKPDLSKIPAQSSYELPTFTLADGLEISLWAENPLLAKPTQCNWDAQGRLWVASSAMYPMIAPGQEATDKIIIIEDPGHTGKATKATAFADGLLIPTGVAPVLVQEGGERASGRAGFQPAVPGILPGTPGVVGSPKPEARAANDPARTASGDGRKTTSDAPGKIPGAAGNIPALPDANAAPRWACYVGQSTELLYFEDTKGTGKADKKRIVFSGFGTEDTHHIVHTLRWGPDGRLYFSQSVYIHTHMETPWGVVRVNSGGVFAYDPRTERVEVVEKGLWNTWGHAWDQWGQAFYTDGAGSTGLSWGFPGATFAPNEGARRTMASISPGSYPKFAGLELIYSPHFPADWQGTAVTCDFRAHKVVHFKINDLGETAPEPAGAANGKNPQSAIRNPQSGYVTEQLPVLVQTSDATFRPIDVKLGPDGAIYIADWSNPIINHGEVDFRDPRRDHEHGRIWRLSMKGGAAVKWESLVKANAQTLLEKTTSPSLWESEQANQVFIQNLESANTAQAARKKLDDMLLHPPTGSKASLDLLKTVRLNRALPMRTKDDAAIAALRSSSNPNLRAEAVEYFNPEHAIDANRALDDFDRLFKEAEERATPIEKIKKRIEELDQLIRKEPKRKNELEKEIEALMKEMKEMTKGGFECGVGVVEAFELAVSWSTKALAREQNPRVRVMIMRRLARIPTVESVSLILDAAINAPKDDPQYEFAAWLSINDLAEVWTKAVLAGEWKPEGREKQFEFALNAIEPRLAGQVLSQFVSTGRAPLDGSGPWIELIGNTGGPGELRPLLDALLAATTGMMRLADPKPPFKTPGANTRAAAALVAAARRGVKPAGGMPPWQFYTNAPTDALPDVLRLAGLWKQNFPAAMFDALDTKASAPVLDAAFEALRTLATPEAADFLTAYFDPAMEQKLGNASLHRVIAKSDNNWRIHALLALAPLRPGEAMKHLDTVLAETPEPQRVNVWRTLFAEGPFMQKFMQSIPANFSPATAATALRAARELGRRGQPLVAKLAPLAGEKAATVTAPANYTDLAARAKKDGDPVAGEAIYRRMASACTTCHAIGGAGGKLGPDMTSIGASAPPDYIIESVLDPAAKVKEGYHAFAFKMKDGSEAIGIPSRETATEQFIRTIAGEQGLPKANIVSKKLAEGGASLMPAGLTAAWSDRERLNLYAFLMELGRPGPFDASKNNVARAWQLTDSGATNGALKANISASPDAQSTTPAIFAYTLVDGRLTKDLLAEKLAILQPKNATVHLTTRFQAASAGKARLNLTGIRKAWLDGQPLAIASEPSPSVDLTAGAHTFTVEMDAKSPPDVLRLESPAASFIGD